MVKVRPTKETFLLGADSGTGGYTRLIHVDLEEILVSAPLK
jgi:hypothetical protein